MNYLTTSELSKIWNISTRRITFYCEEGLITGAEKKGRAWLIPANAQKPVDRRKSTSTVITIDDNIAKQGVSSVYSKAEIDDFDNTYYYAKDLYRHLGLTRETLRYYEKIGLIDPRRQIENAYRKFEPHDIDNIIGIDFLKKRGFSPLEIENMRKHPNPSNNSLAMKKKVVEVEQNIYNQQCILKRLKDTQELYEYARANDGKFEIREFPLYSVLKSMDSTYDFSNYSGNFLRKLEGEDLSSHIVRAVSFDSTGLKGSKMCIVKKVTVKSKDSEEQFLENGQCIYTTSMVLTEQDRSSAIEKIFITVHKWAKEHNVELNGIGYGFNRFVLLGKNADEDLQQYVAEMWFPIK